jgi:hypothetical protein
MNKGKMKRNACRCIGSAISTEGDDIIIYY